MSQPQAKSGAELRAEPSVPNIWGDSHWFPAPCHLGKMLGVPSLSHWREELVKDAEWTWNRSLPVPELTALRAVITVPGWFVSTCPPSNPCAPPLTCKPEPVHRVVSGGGDGVRGGHGGAAGVDLDSATPLHSRSTSPFLPFLYSHLGF